VVARAENAFLVGDAFVEHQLSINRVYIALKFLPAPAGIRFRSWRSFRETLSRSCAIVPDGYAEIDTPARTLRMFVEVDLGTEGHAVWTNKVQAYLHFAISGEFQERFGAEQFRVLVAANSFQRLERLRKLVGGCTEKIFWFSTLERIQNEGIWSPIWFRPGGSGPQALVGGAA
jgi:hypothetical protein